MGGGGWFNLIRKGNADNALDDWKKNRRKQPPSRWGAVIALLIVVVIVIYIFRGVF